MSPKLVSTRIAAVIAVAAIAFYALPRAGRAPSSVLLAGVTPDMTLSQGTGPAPGTYAQSGTLIGPGMQPVRLAATPSAPLTGWLSPVLVPTADRRTFLYETWRQSRADDPASSWASQGIQLGDPLGVPEIRRVDTLTGADTLFETGATSPMISTDGRVALVRGATREFVAGASYTGTIMVRATLDAPSVAWTQPNARYAAAAWAGARLLVYRIGEGESLQLVALDGPNAVRALGSGTLVAVDPTATFAFTAQSDAATPQVSVVRLSDGAVVSTLSIDPSLGIDFVSYAGGWTSDLVIARGGAGLVLFRVGDTSISIADVLGFDATAFPSGTIQPRFAKTDGTEITTWADQVDVTGAPRRVELDCQIATHACTVFPMVDAAAQPGYNPSAPFAG